MVTVVVGGRRWWSSWPIARKEAARKSLIPLLVQRAEKRRFNSIRLRRMIKNDGRGTYIDPLFTSDPANVHHHPSWRPLQAYHIESSLVVPLEATLFARDDRRRLHRISVHPRPHLAASVVLGGLPASRGSSALCSVSRGGGPG